MTESRITYRPGFPLNQIVDVIWVAKADSLELSAPHHACMFTELIFNYGAQFQVEGQNTEHYASGDEHYIISGLKTEPFHTHVSGKHLNIGFLLKPSAYHVLRTHFANKSMRMLSEVLYEELIIPETPRFHNIEGALSTFFGPPSMDPDLLRFERHVSSEWLRKGAMKEFSDSTSLTQKSFIAKFKKHYCITPKEYVRLKQVNYATTLMEQRSLASLTEIGLEAGFYDQSHFIRTFKKHHGCTPRQFRQNQGLDRVHSVQF